MSTKRKATRTGASAGTAANHSGANDLFSDDWDDPADSSDHLVDILLANPMLNGTRRARAVSPAWQRIERHRDDLWLRRQLQEVF